MLWVQGIVKRDEFKAYTARLQSLHERRFPTDKFAEKEILDSYAEFLKSELMKRFPPDVNREY